VTAITSLGNSAREAVKAEIEKQQEFLDSFWTLSDDIAKLDGKFKKLSKPDISKKAIADLEAYAQSFVKIYNKLHDHEGKECPTCGSDIDIDRMTSQYKKAKKDLAECESATYYYTMKRDLAEMRTELKHMFEGRNPDPKLMEKLEKELKSTTKKLDALESQYALLEEYTEAKARLEALREPKKVKKPKSGTIKKLKRFVDDLRTRQRLEDALAELKVPSKSYKALREELDDCESQLQKLRKKLNALAEESRDFKGRSTEFRVLNSQRKELEAKIKELQPHIFHEFLGREF
jgi:DNA repair exonuclease SbcCD ATPase subunit